jgi:hypothetical protein
MFFRNNQRQQRKNSWPKKQTHVLILLETQKVNEIENYILEKNLDKRRPSKIKK